MAWMSTLAMGASQGAQMYGQQQMNLANRTFSAQQAQLQRNWEQSMQMQAESYNTQMSDTAMTRRMMDLRAAGVNPMIAVSGPGLGGATAPQVGAPSGAMAATPQTANPAAGLTGAAASAIDAMNQIQQTNANVAKTNSDTALNNARLPYAAQNAARQNVILDDQDKNLQQEGLNLLQDWRKKHQDADIQSFYADPDYAQKTANLALRKAELDNQYKQYGLSREADASAWYSSPTGKLLFPLTQINGLEGQSAAIIAEGINKLQSGKGDSWVDRSMKNLENWIPDPTLMGMGGTNPPTP